MKKAMLRFGWLLKTIRNIAEEFAVEVSVPTLVSGDARDSWLLDFYGQKAHLARSNALHISATSALVGSCFCIQKVFRIEDAGTPYHLSEFSLFECAIPRTDCLACMDRVEGMIRRIQCEAVEAFGQNEVAVLCQEPFVRLDWIDAVNKVCSIGHVDFNHSPGADVHLDLSHVCVKENAPIFLVDLPQGQVSWACKDMADGRKVSFNLIVPYAGEVSEGGERETDRGLLMDRFKRANRMPQLSWYASSIEKVESPLSVFAIGLERLAMWLFKYDDIGDVNGFLRKRCFPEIKLEDSGGTCAEG